MKPYDELSATMGVIQRQMINSINNQSANALKEFKCLCKEFGFSVEMLKGLTDEGRKTLWTSSFPHSQKTSLQNSPFQSSKIQETEMRGCSYTQQK